MSKRKDEDLVGDIVEAINRINTYTAGLSYDEFFLDSKSQDAVIRNLEILGEAVKLLSNNFRENYPDLPWKEISGTRDKLIHDYFGVNIDIVWDIVKNELPSVYRKIQDIIKP